MFSMLKECLGNLCGDNEDDNQDQQIFINPLFDLTEIVIDSPKMYNEEEEFEVLIDEQKIK